MAVCLLTHLLLMCAASSVLTPFASAHCNRRMVEVDPGSILIDGVDIRQLGLKQLRSQMSIIPQVRVGWWPASKREMFRHYTALCMVPGLWFRFCVAQQGTVTAGVRIKLTVQFGDFHMYACSLFNLTC
jgi:hypothetical protein